MEVWQFLLQRQGESAWIPLESSPVDLQEGWCRLLVQTSRKGVPLEIRIIYQPPAGSSRKILTHRRQAHTSRDGLLVVFPFSHLHPGVWQVSCRADLLEDCLGESWQYNLVLCSEAAAPPQPLSPANVLEGLLDQVNAVAEAVADAVLQEVFPSSAPTAVPKLSLNLDLLGFVRPIPRVELPPAPAGWVAPPRLSTLPPPSEGKRGPDLPPLQEERAPLGGQRIEPRFLARLNALASTQLDPTSLPLPILDPTLTVSSLGELVSVSVQLPASNQALGAKVWMSNPETGEFLDGPHILMNFSPDGQGRLEKTLHLSTPGGYPRVEISAVTFMGAQESQPATLLLNLAQAPSYREEPRPA